VRVRKADRYCETVDDISLQRPDGRHARRETTRRLLQQAAVDLFEEHGYDATSTVQVANRAGVSERTLFRIFVTKAGLVWHDPFVFSLLADLETPSAPHRPAARLLADAVLRAVEGMSDDEWQLNIRRRAIALSEPDLIAAGTQDLARVGERLEAAIRMSADDSPADDQQPSALTLFTWFSLVGFSRVPLAPETGRDEWARALIRVIDLAAHGALVRRL
jgi:AcrR family transcriptional regulator